MRDFNVWKSSTTLSLLYDLFTPYLLYYSNSSIISSFSLEQVVSHCDRLKISGEIETLLCLCDEICEVYEMEEGD